MNLFFIIEMKVCMKLNVLNLRKTLCNFCIGKYINAVCDCFNDFEHILKTVF